MVLAAAAADAAAATVVAVAVAAVVPGAGDPGLDSREQCCHLAIF